MPALTPDDRCPCLSGDMYGACCRPLHAGEAIAPTAERLMRSRYSAFVAGDATYLLATWHPRTRPRSLKLDPDVEWRRLDIVRTSGGGPFEREGTVEFRAHFRRGGERGVQHELSRFVRDGGAWLYVEGSPAPEA